MTRQIVTIPRHMTLTDNVDWDIDWRGQSARESNSGASVAVINAFPRWVGSPTLNLHGANVLLWRALRLQVQGRVGLYRITMQDPRAVSLCADFGIVSGTYESGIPYSTGYRHSTGVGFFFEPFVTTSAAAVAGASSITVDAGTGPTPTVGQIMSYDDRPFSVVNVIPVSGTIWTLEIQMPLRSAIPASAEILHIGRGIFETVDASAGNPAYEWNRPSRPRLNLQEYLGR